MRLYDQGCFYRVTMSDAEICSFMRRWPCSGLKCKPISMTFDKRNGDLVDSNDAQNHPNADGGALLALAEKMQNWALDRIGAQDCVNA